MKNKITYIVAIVCLVVGFVIGQEYTKYQIRTSIDQALSSLGEESVETSDEATEQFQDEKKDVKTFEFEIGEEFELATLKYTVNSSEEKDMIKSSYGQPHLASNETKFIVLNISVTNTTKETFDYSGEGLALETETGEIYRTYSDTIGNIDDYLVYKELTPNIPVSGYVVFRLPESVDSYSLVTKKSGSEDFYIVKLK